MARFIIISKSPVSAIRQQCGDAKDLGHFTQGHKSSLVLTPAGGGMSPDCPDLQWEGGVRMPYHEPKYQQIVQNAKKQMEALWTLC